MPRLIGKGKLRAFFSFSLLMLGLDCRFLDDHYDSLCRAEARMQKTAAIASSLAIVISSLGLLGMVSFRAERRRREIGIRKGLGASLSGVVRTSPWQRLPALLPAGPIPEIATGE